MASYRDQRGEEAGSVHPHAACWRIIPVFPGCSQTAMTMTNKMYSPAVGFKRTPPSGFRGGWIPLQRRVLQGDFVILVAIKKLRSILRSVYAKYRRYNSPQPVHEITNRSENTGIPRVCLGRHAFADDSAHRHRGRIVEPLGGVAPQRLAGHRPKPRHNANARLALMLALGDLQKSLGPDRAVTATSEILATPTAAVAKPNTTGVWESWWDFNPNASPDYANEKTSRFRRWLVSSAVWPLPKRRTLSPTHGQGKPSNLSAMAHSVPAPPPTPK